MGSEAWLQLVSLRISWFKCIHISRCLLFIRHVSLVFICPDKTAHSISRLLFMYLVHQKSHSSARNHTCRLLTHTQACSHPPPLPSSHLRAPLLIYPGYRGNLVCGTCGERGIAWYETRNRARADINSRMIERDATGKCSNDMTEF